LAAEGDNPYEAPGAELAPASARVTRTGKLAWEEPAPFIRAWERATQGRPGPWPPLLRAAATAAALFAAFRVSVWVRGQEHPQLGFWGMLAVALGIGFVAGYLLPFIRALSPAQVWIDDDGVGRQSIVRTNALEVERWPWDEIGACALERLELGGRAFEALVLRFPGRPERAIGLSRKVTAARVEAFLKEREIDVRNDLG
jgi:hypothetical protein